MKLSDLVPHVATRPAVLNGNPVTLRLVPTAIYAELRACLPEPPPAIDDISRARRTADAVEMELLEIATSAELEEEVEFHYAKGDFPNVKTKAVVTPLKLESLELAKRAPALHAWVAAALTYMGRLSDPDLRDARKKYRELDQLDLVAEMGKGREPESSPPPESPLKSAEPTDKTP